MLKAIGYLLVIVVCLIPADIYAREKGKHILIPKVGAFSIDKTDQGTRVFEKKSDSVFGLEYERHFDFGFSIGPEWIHYENDFTNMAAYAAVTNIIFFNTKYYFNRPNALRPFVGVGVGYGRIKETGEFLIGSHSGFSSQLIAGLIYRFKYVGIYTEYKKVFADLEDQYSGATVSRINMSGNGIFIGINILL